MTWRHIVLAFIVRFLVVFAVLLIWPNISVIAFVVLVWILVEYKHAWRRL